MTQFQPIFITRQPVRIAEVRQLLTGSGIAADPVAVYPDELPRAAAGAGDCLVIVDGSSLPERQIIVWIRRHSPGSRIVVWTDFLTPELLLATIEYDLDGLLSSRLPLEEAACALSRICRGERLLRFDSDPDKVESARAVADNSPFDAQWMLHGSESQGRRK